MRHDRLISPLNLITLLVLMCGACVASAAVTGSEVRLESTTVPGVAAEAIGSFDVSQADALIFRTPKGNVSQIVMPDGKLTDFSYSERVAWLRRWQWELCGSGSGSTTSPSRG